MGGPFSPSQTPSSHDSDTHDGPEENIEEEPSQDLEVNPPSSSVIQCNKQRWHPDEDDEEFTANEDEEDEEDTIAAEEQLEGEVDHAMELSELAREGELSMEELLQQYAGAYAYDASAPGSGNSEDEDEVEANSSDCELEETVEEAAQEDSSSQSDSAEEHSEDEDDEHSEEEMSGSSQSEESESDESEDAQSQSQADEEQEDEGDDDDDDGDDDDDFGVEYLLARDDERSEVDGGSGPPTPGPTTTLGPKKEITDIAAAAESLQPKGYTLATTQVPTGSTFSYLDLLFPDSRRFISTM